VTLANEAIYILEHCSFIVFGALYWWMALGPAPRQVQCISKGWGVLYQVLACQPMVALGVLLTVTSHPLYQPYIAAPHLFGLTPLDDQQLGGVVMWLPTIIFSLTCLAMLLFQRVGECKSADRTTAAGPFYMLVDPNNDGDLATTMERSVLLVPQWEGHQ
jgi:cytochrome c oxidase assembly factor CtaG